MQEQLSAISVDVEMMEDRRFDVWISTEGSSGAHYTGITSDEIGRYIADLVEVLAEAAR